MEQEIIPIKIKLFYSLNLHKKIYLQLFDIEIIKKFINSLKKKT